jgi:hypothetical protein
MSHAWETSSEGDETLFHAGFTGALRSATRFGMLQNIGDKNPGKPTDMGKVLEKLPW